MSAIEPNWISSLWFGAFTTICAVAFLVVAGVFPLRSRPDTVKSIGTLVFGNAVLLVTLLTTTGLYGYSELRWSTLVVVTGLVILFAPGLFQAWPSSLRDGRTGLAVLVGIQALALVTLAKVTAASWVSML